MDDGRDAARGGHLFLQVRKSDVLTTKWRWVYCRTSAAAAAAAAAATQQQLLVYDSIESSSDPAVRPLESIPLPQTRCFSLLDQVGHKEMSICRV